MKPWTYKGCNIAPEKMDKPTLAGCNNGVNRYLTTLWRITFPDNTWTRVGTKRMAISYVESKGHSYGVVGTTGSA
jgi:hypothetical protein